jgi:hypothetical protein
MAFGRFVRIVRTWGNMLRGVEILVQARVPGQRVMLSRLHIGDIKVHVTGS